jgi:glycosyltransferase involved in cell wall biosynthesis
MAPRLSVILTTYNSARTLKPCLESLAGNLDELCADDVEVLVPDRSSTDGTREILKGFPRCRVIPHEMAGICAAHNLGVSEAKGAFGVFLNSDDELGPGFLRTMLELAESREPERHVVYSTVQFIDVNGHVLYERHPAPYIGALQRIYSVILHPNAIYPMELLKKHPFEILPGNPPRDREQVYELMKHAVCTRTRAVKYRFRIWSSSGSVQLAAKKKREDVPLSTRIWRFLGRVYIQSYETNILDRILSRRMGKASYWKSPA